MLRDILESRWFTAAIIAIVGFFSISVIKLSLPIITISKELKNIDQKIDETKKTSLELEKLGAYLQSDAYLERQARIQLNYKKPYEKVVYVYRSPSAKIQNSDNLAIKKNNNLFTNIADWLSGLFR